MLARYLLSSWVCRSVSPPVLLSQAGIVSKRLRESSWVSARRLFSTYPTLSNKEIQVYPNLRVYFPLELCPELNFSTASRSRGLSIGLVSVTTVYAYGTRRDDQPTDGPIYRILPSFLPTPDRPHACLSRLHASNCLLPLSLQTQHSRLPAHSHVADTIRPKKKNKLQGKPKSKLLILSECVNTTDKIGRTWTNTNSYRRKWSIVWYFHVKYFTSQLLYV